MEKAKWEDPDNVINPEHLAPRIEAGRVVHPASFVPGKYCKWEWLGHGVQYGVTVGSESGTTVQENRGGTWMVSSLSLEDLLAQEQVTLARWDERGF